VLYLGTTTTSTGSSPHVWTLCTLAPRIVTAAADICHSLAVTQDGTVNSWGKARQSHMPTGLGYADMQDKLVPARVAPHHMRPTPSPLACPPAEVAAPAMNDRLARKMREW
jgi:hypothetical protein